ncbi:MAG: NAD(P)-dependent oxidoreductase [Acetobacteraceae bacterium]
MSLRCSCPSCVHTPRAYDRVRDGNFSIEGLIGFNLHGKTFGIIGLGQIGRAVAAIAHGMGCRLLAYDPVHEPCDLPITFLALEEVLAASHVVSLPRPPDAADTITWLTRAGSL